MGKNVFQGLPVMPKVTVCPRTPNVNSILLKLMRKYPHVVKVSFCTQYFKCFV